MAKGNKKGKKRTQSRSKRPSAMTSAQVDEVKTWINRMREYAAKAIKLAERMSYAEMHETNDLFWALAKYAENVEESAIQLDQVNTQIYPALIEMDMEVWQSLKDMRSRLAHAFWSIDPEILWTTVTQDFPALLDLLSMIIVVDQPIGSKDHFEFQVESDRLLDLPDAVGGQAPEAGRFVVALAFGYDGRVRVFRVSHAGDRTLVVHSNFNTTLTVTAEPIGL